MSIAKVIEVTARSDKSFEDAIAEGVSKAGDSVHGIKEAWVKGMKAQVSDGKVVRYHVDLKLTFQLD